MREVPMKKFFVVAMAAVSCAQPAAREPQVPPEQAPVRAESAASDESDAAQLRQLYSVEPARWPAPTLDPDVEHRELGLVPKRAPTTDPTQLAREELGRTLFFDARLSGNGQLACASCHDAELGFGDGRAVSFGEGFLALARNAPSISNASLRTSWFWDGRATSLEEQALMVFTNPREMHTTPEAVVDKLRSSQGYRDAFARAFGDGDVTIDVTLRAITAFENTLVSDGSSDFDHFLEGQRDALSDAAVRGLHLFRTKARCLNCHNGPLFTDEQFHNLGLTYYGRKYEDLGRYNVTKEPADVGRFRTPSLRNVGRTGPYMHNGLFELDGVLNMYSAGMPNIRAKPEQANDPLFPVKSPRLQALDLTPEEKSDLSAFLMSLTERKRRIRAPDLPVLGDA